MKIKKQQLIDVLQVIKPAVSQKGIVEQMDCFLFTGQYVFAYNDKISIGHPFETDFNCGISAEELYRVIAKCPSDDIDLSFTENELVVAAKKFKSGIKHTEGELFDILPDKVLNAVKWKSAPAEMQEGIDLCSFSAAKDASVPFLNCVAVIQDHIVSSDNYRVSRYTLPKAIPDSFLLPVKAAVELCKISGISHYSLHAGWALFKNKETGVIFCARVVAVDYPDASISDILDVKGERFKIPDEVLPAIEACDIFADPVALDSRMTLKIQKDVLCCKSKNDRGWMEYSLDVKTKIDNLEIDINPIFLGHILKHATMVTHGENKLLFRSGAFQHVMALC